LIPCIDCWACTDLPPASFALANPRTVLANPPDRGISTTRKFRGFANSKMKFCFQIGKSAGPNDAGERFLQGQAFCVRGFVQVASRAYRVQRNREKFCVRLQSLRPPDVFPDRNLGDSIGVAQSSPLRFYHQGGFIFSLFSDRLSGIVTKACALTQRCHVLACAAPESPGWDSNPN